MALRKKTASQFNTQLDRIYDKWNSMAEGAQKERYRQKLEQAEANTAKARKFKQTRLENYKGKGYPVIAYKAGSNG